MEEGPAWTDIQRRQRTAHSREGNDPPITNYYERALKTTSSIPRSLEGWCFNCLGSGHLASASKETTGEEGGRGPRGHPATCINIYNFHQVQFMEQFRVGEPGMLPAPGMERNEPWLGAHALLASVLGTGPEVSAA
ncbi:hypothetical protein E2562_006502 [Oryza meyeriana var. granulata]|uniref:Uncharacterized protein n=1 Tax=Oryza meyeriana var. granulata TaxID=110450 RepID=A0A6G1CNZ7_9ORYZ|nr:hypothetical protein E2562_006502 [Oryza meyeriana var. granulata]